MIKKKNMFWKSVKSNSPVQEKNFNRSMERFYFKGNLNLSRLSEENIEAAKRIFAQKFPDSELLIITDNIDLIKRGVKYYLDVKENEIARAVIAFESDQKAYSFLKDNKNLEYISAQSYYPTSRYFHKDDLAKEILVKQSEIQAEKFEVADYENIIQVLENIKNVEGDYVEIGVYKGGSAYTALKYLKERKIDKKVYLLDTFEGFQYKEARESNDRFWINRLDNVAPSTVIEFLKEFDNYSIIKSNIISESLPSEIEKIAACNIDVDMYEAIAAALNKVCRLMTIGGIIILEDVGHTPALIGAHLAYMEFMNSIQGEDFHNILLSSGQALLIRYK